MILGYTLLLIIIYHCWLDGLTRCDGIAFLLVIFQSNSQKQLHATEHEELVEMLLIFCNHGLEHDSGGHLCVEIHIVHILLA